MTSPKPYGVSTPHSSVYFQGRDESTPIPELFRRVRPRTLVTPDRLSVLYDLALRAQEVAGDFAECGVYKGGTAMVMAQFLKNPATTLWLFDTFKGIPKGDPGVDGSEYLSGGAFSETSEREVLAAVKELGPVSGCVRAVPGLFRDTLNEASGRRFSLVHVDVDLYWSARECIRFFCAKMSPGGVILFDDYGFPECCGVKKAVDEAEGVGLISHRISLPTGQAMVTF